MAEPLTKSQAKADKKPRSRGRPAFKPTDDHRRTIKAMAGYGILHTEIATVIGIDEKTLRKYFRTELDTGSTVANAKVAESLYKNAIVGNVSAQIFWLKARAGWVDRQFVDNRVSGDVTVKVVRFGDNPSK